MARHTGTPARVASDALGDPESVAPHVNGGADADGSRSRLTLWADGLYWKR